MSNSLILIAHNLNPSIEQQAGLMGDLETQAAVLSIEHRDIAHPQLSEAIWRYAVSRQRSRKKGVQR